MKRTFVYSFEDCSVTFSHPTYGVYSAYGSGLGNFSISFAGNVSAHSVASDLSVIVSKHAVKNGQIEFSIPQATDFNNWLKGWANHIENVDISEFAATTITIKNKSTGDTYFCSGCTHEKVADQSFQADAQDRTWNILVADIALQ